MLAMCKQFFEFLFHGPYMHIIPQRCQRALAHVRDTFTKFWGIHKYEIHMLVTCRKRF